jgi:hypothetical protein
MKMENVRAKKAAITDADERLDLEASKRPLPASGEREGTYLDWVVSSINLETILSRLKTYERFEVKSGYVMSGLPKFDDLTAYGPSEQDEINLWKKEVARLVQVANSHEAIHLQGHEDWFGKADRSGYTKLHKIGVQLQDALDICIHDNELVFTEHMPSQADRENYQGAHDRLARDYDVDQQKERFQRHLHLDHDNDRYYHAMVNYITSMLLRILLRTMRGALWEEQCVVTIAKFAAKLKTLVSDLPASASLSLARTEEVRLRTKQESEMRSIGKYDSVPEDGLDGNVAGMGQSPQRMANTQFKTGRMDAEMRYFILMKTFHLGISRLLLSALSNLSSNEHTEMSTDVFDSSVFMYEDHITDRRLFLCCQRDGTIGAAADPMVIKSAGAAFEVCLDAWKSLIPPTEKVEAEDEGQSRTEKESDDWTLLSWKWTEIDPKTFEPQPDHSTASRKLCTMKSAINALVPYFMVCGSFPTLLHEMSNEVFLISDPTEPVKPVTQSPFVAIFNVRTSAYMAKRFLLSQDYDASNISHSILARGKALARSATTGLPMMYADERQAVTDKALRSDRDAERKRMAKAMQEFRTWISDETSIIISNKLYAWGFLSACTVLVLGGLAMGLSVGDRIRGVDPLGLASYCWVLAGFVLIIAKSLRVENWPWSRFFRGQVVCRSVSEVRSVTGMDAQTILAILLRLEPRMNLIKRGPFNAVFSKRGAEGFAIDIPFHTRTLFDGGLLLVKVQSVFGDALVGIRSDLWTRYDSVSPKADNGAEDKVICRDFSDPGKWVSGSKEYHLYKLSRSNIRWFRVVGLFEKDAYFD